MDLSRRSTMSSIIGSSTPSSQGGDSPPARSAHGQHVRQMSSFSYAGRPPSIHGSVQPSTSRSILSMRPGTPGGSLGVNSEVKVESRPLTQQGLMTSRSNCQGPGRQVQDKTYYLNKIRIRKQELQAEIDVMNEEIEKLQKREPANGLLEKKQKALNEEVMALKVQLGDYNAVMEKVATGVELEEFKEQLRVATEKNEADKEKVDRLISERTRKEQSYKADEEKIQLLEAEIERRVNDEDGLDNLRELEGLRRLLDIGQVESLNLNCSKLKLLINARTHIEQMSYILLLTRAARERFNCIKLLAPEVKARYVELRNDASTLTAEVERLESELQDVNMSAQSLEQELASAPLEKKREVMLTEQLLIAEAELSRLKAEEPSSVKLSPEEARGAMLLKIRQDNAEIAKTEEKIKQVEEEVREYEEKIAEADKSLSELKGGRAEKFHEMQQKEKKMQAFIDNFDAMRNEHHATARLVQERIVQLLKETNQDQASKKGDDDFIKSQQSANDIDELLIVVEERQQELNQLEEAKEKNLKELAYNEGKIATLKAEVAKLGHLDDLRTQWDSKCSKLEAQKSIVDENRRLLQAKLNEQEAKAESIQAIFSGNEAHAKLEELKQRLSNLQQSGIKLQEDVDLKERETNYKPVLENIRFMVDQLNTEIKAQNAR